MWDRRRRSAEEQRPQQGETPVTPPVGKRQEVASEKRISVGTRLARYRAQLDLIQRRCRMTSEERPSVLERLKGYKAQAGSGAESLPRPGS